jgi:glycosyltransferase involved in cell wall biosynthesis
MRISFTDLVFSWPPKGGADVDVYHVLKELQAIGHEVQLIGLSCDGIWDRPGFDPHDLPFPALCLPFTRQHFQRKQVVKAICDQVAAWNPEAAILGDAFFLKPYLAEALQNYPLAARYYAYEMSCHRDVLRFRDGAPCPYDYLQTPEECRRCALDYLAPDLKRDHLLAWTQEYLAAEAYQPDYHRFTTVALRHIDAAIVYNPQMQGLLAPFVKQVFVVPGGVDERFLGSVGSVGSDGSVGSGLVTILMAGRAEDPAKGLSVLMEAGSLLAQDRVDFQIRATAPEDVQPAPWFQPLGWQPYADLPALYAAADIAVVPSIWEEPFGMVALEAMAAGLPVCASRVGGLQAIVRHEESGYLFERGNGVELAEQLARLLDDPGLRRRMGDAGKRLVKEKYTWPVIVQRHYTPILEHLAGLGKQ